MSGSLGDKGSSEFFLLDGHNNPGFSGGPVVFRASNKVDKEFYVMAVVSGFRTENVQNIFEVNQQGWLIQQTLGSWFVHR
jgi:hypothetical protein